MADPVGTDHLYKKVELAGPGIDTLSGFPGIISSVHAHAHRGKVFHMAVKQTGLADTASAEFLIRVPAAIYPHVHRFRVNLSAGDVDIVQYEGATITAPGTPVSTFNTNRNSSNVPSTLIYGAPTVGADGTEIHRMWTPSMGTGIGQSQVGISDAEAGEEWILKPSTDYLMRITNNSGAALSFWAEMLWYEL